MAEAKVDLSKPPRALVVGTAREVFVRTVANYAAVHGYFPIPSLTNAFAEASLIAALDFEKWVIARVGAE